MKAPSTVKTWENTKRQGLVRHKNGGYYARFFLNGKEVWKSLKTKHYTVAEGKLAEAQKEHLQRKGTQASTSSAKMTFGQAAKLHMTALAGKVDIKQSTRDYWEEILAAVLKSWPGLETTEIRKLTKTACKEWAAVYSTKVSATRYNNAVSLLRHVIAIAEESGIVFTNVADSLQRKTVKQKLLELPTLAQFAECTQVMRAAGGRDSKNCADLTEGLAYTGCRIGESSRIEWRDLHFTNGEIVVKGDPEDRTKNGEIRRIPMIPAARALFERMRAERAEEPANAPVFKVHECQKALDRAVKLVKMPRVTHHDLRHFFATICIESGVDIPTVSRWLGHKDGGALAMKTYGHLRREHSVSQAQKVSFAPAA